MKGLLKGLLKGLTKGSINIFIYLFLTASISISVFLLVIFTSLTVMSATKSLQGDNWKSSNLSKTWTPSGTAGTLVTAQSVSGDMTAVASGDNTLVTLQTVTASKGGTGQTTFTKGDILVASSSTTLSKLTVGSNGTFLMASSDQTTGVKWELRHRTVGAQIASGCGSVTSQNPGTWISSVSSGGTGQCTVNFLTGMFSSQPYCFALAGATGAGTGEVAIGLVGLSTSAFTWFMSQPGVGPVNRDTVILCSGLY